MSDAVKGVVVHMKNHRRDLLGIADFLVADMEGDNGCAFAVNEAQARRFNDLAFDDRRESLTVGMLETLAHGEHSEQLAVVARNPAFIQPIYDLLVEIFESPPLDDEGWESPTESASPPLDVVGEIDGLYAKATHPPYVEGDFVYDALRGSVHYKDFALITCLVNRWPEIRSLLSNPQGAEQTTEQGNVAGASTGSSDSAVSNDAVAAGQIAAGLCPTCRVHYVYCKKCRSLHCACPTRTHAAIAATKGADL